MILLEIESPITIISLLMGAIISESGVIVFLFMYIKGLNREIQAIYKEQIKENKDMMEKSNKAFNDHTEAVKEASKLAKESIEVTKSLKEGIAESAFDGKKGLQELRSWLQDNYQKK